MKYTDRFFKIPVRLYDMVSMAEAALTEQKTFQETQQVKNEIVKFLVALRAVSPYDIEGYSEAYSNEVDFDDVAEHGFNVTLINFKNGESMECIWKFAEFEEKLNAFMAENEASIALNENKNA